MWFSPYHAGLAQQRLRHLHCVPRFPTMLLSPPAFAFRLGGRPQGHLLPNLGPLRGRSSAGLDGARFPFIRLKQALLARWRAGLLGPWRRWPKPACAVGVYEADCCGFVRRAPSRVRGDCLFADCLAGGLDPRFPFLRGLWFVVGVQQQFPAERTPAVLRLEQAQPGSIQRGCATATPLGPVLGQCRVIG